MNGVAEAPRWYLTMSGNDAPARRKNSRKTVHENKGNAANENNHRCFFTKYMYYWHAF